MNSSEYSHINDELLSAYLDDAVTDQERVLVEAAVATDRNIAWRLETLKHTILLLNGLPEMAVPRSFALQQAQVGDVLSERRLPCKPSASLGRYAVNCFGALGKHSTSLALLLASRKPDAA